MPYEIPDMLLEIPNTAYVFKSNENTNVKRKHNPNSRKESMVPTAVVVACLSEVENNGKFHRLKVDTYGGGRLRQL